jgi:hypothetical protein
MTGLLDFLKTPAGQGLLATGLGAAASYGRGRGLLGNLGAGGLMGLQAFTGAEDAQRQAAIEAKRNELYDVQTQAYKADVDRKNAALDAERRKREALPGLFRGPGMTGGEAVPQEVGGIPMFSQPMSVSPMQQTPGGLDVMGALRAGFSPAEIQELAGLNNVGKAEVARTVEVDDGKGGKMTVQLDKFGRPVGQGMPGYVAPVQVNQGGQVSFVRPAPGVSLPVTMSPAERDASARGWAGINIQRDQASAGKAPPGYRFKQDGSLEAIPGGPADIKAGEAGEKQRARTQSALAQSESVLKEITDAKKLVGWTTAGVGGTLANVPATSARDLAAKLQTIKANLGFDRLQQMRDQSPTGGALGQVAVQELASLQATVASLDQMQSPAQLAAALEKVENHYRNWQNAVRQAAGGTGGATGGASGGWSIQKVN